MDGSRKIYRAIDLAGEIAVANARALEAVARARTLLEDPPDTFLGRKSHDFIAMPEDADDADCWIYPDQPKATNYRAYMLNDHGRIFTFAELEAQGDAEATWQAQHLRDGFDIEVWQERRRVAVLKATK
ncbi:MAG: hypothetical protein JO283_09815 [Bradyrhizobium sp.]|nr:hypothetical protein [Bradyrhizobium sp.]